MTSSFRLLLLGFFAGASAGCGGRLDGTASETSDAGSIVQGRFLFDCVAYDVGCPIARSIADTSQEPMPPAIAVGSTFIISFVPDVERAYDPRSSQVTPSSPNVATVPPSPYTHGTFPGLEGVFTARAAGSAEIDAVMPAGTVANRTKVTLVNPSRLAFVDADGNDVPMPLQMVPMGQVCLYVVPETGSGEPLAGLPNCEASTPSDSVRILPDGPPGVVCIDGESHGAATVTVTCGPTSASFSVELSPPPTEDAGSLDATVDATVDASDAANDGDAHPCVTSCGDATCVDTGTDPANCGGCGVVCDGTCQRGRCVVTLATGQDHPFAIVSDGANVYWTNRADGGPGSGAVMRVSVNGGAPISAAPSQDGPNYIVIDGTRAYWTTAKAVVAMPLDGGAPVAIASAQSYPMGIAVDATNVYWTNEGSGEVMKLALDGGAPVALTPSVVGANPQQLVIDDTRAYWFEFASNTILTVPLAGGTQSSFYYDSNFDLQGWGSIAPTSITRRRAPAARSWHARETAARRTRLQTTTERNRS